MSLMTVEEAREINNFHKDRTKVLLSDLDAQLKSSIGLRLNDNFVKFDYTEDFQKSSEMPENWEDIVVNSLQERGFKARTEKVWREATSISGAQEVTRLIVEW